ncbi:MAG: TetR family transcriptional regulator, partial [Clostridiales bacterium]|nr:TetR family transcriptional regulator [Clostridiales bacterium]
MALTKTQIAEKSIEILNRDGIDGLTMRLLAKELNIKAASLYWHFADKRALFTEISELLCLALPLPEDGASPIEFLRAVFASFRTVLLSTKDSVIVFENSLPFTPKRMDIIRVAARAFTSLGVKQENLMTVSNMFNNHVLSFVADEQRFKSFSKEQTDSFAAGLLPEDIIVFTAPNDYDCRFMYGLQLLFRGL